MEPDGKGMSNREYQTQQEYANYLCLLDTSRKSVCDVCMREIVCLNNNGSLLALARA